MILTLHNFFRSSTSIRVRAALNLKGLDYGYVPYALRRNEHRAPDFLALNPQGLVPALDLGDGTVLNQSLAIIEYLDERYPDPPLLPEDGRDKAYVRSLAYAVACDIHPVNNLRILQYLEANFGADEQAVAAWFRHWVDAMFGPLEKTLATDPRTGTFCVGDHPSLADLCLFSQAVNNKRFNVDMAPYPTIARIVAACLAMLAFEKALPEHQLDAR